MQVVVDLPEGIFDTIKKTQTYISGQRHEIGIEYNVLYAIYNGTPIPEKLEPLITKLIDDAQEIHNDSYKTKRLADKMDLVGAINNELKSDKETENVV